MSFIKKSKDYERKALVKVLEIDSTGNFVKKVLGFGIKLKKDEARNSFMFLTSSSVLKSSLWTRQGSKIVVERYCSKYPEHIQKEDHREQVLKVLSSVDDNVSFAFFDGKSEDGFLEVDYGDFLEKLPMHRSLYAYAFDGKDIVELTFEDKSSSNTYELTSVSKKDFQVGTAKGAPVISYDRLSNKPLVVGILHITRDGNLYPVFLTMDNVEAKSEPKEQHEEVPPKGEENGSKPVGGNSKPETDEIDRGIQPISEDKKNVLVVTGIKHQKDKTSVCEEETKCLKHETIDEALPHPLMMELVMRLNPDRPLGGDVRSLADAFGYNQIKITYLKSSSNPTQKLLLQEGRTTLLCLSEKLRTIGRDEVADLIDNHIGNNCTCKECGSLR